MQFKHIVISLLLIGVTLQGFASKSTDSSVKAIPTQLTVLKSTALDDNYCNGDVMNSNGYAKTLKKHQKLLIPNTVKTQTDLVKYVALSITHDHECSPYIGASDSLPTEFSIGSDRVAHISVGSPAGISISMCICEPLIRVNLLRLANKGYLNIKDVVFDYGD